MSYLFQSFDNERVWRVKHCTEAQYSCLGFTVLNMLYLLVDSSSISTDPLIASLLVNYHNFNYRFRVKIIEKNKVLDKPVIYFWSYGIRHRDKRMGLWVMQYCVLFFQESYWKSQLELCVCNEKLNPLILLFSQVYLCLLSL